MHILTTLSEPLIYLVTFAIVFAETGIVAFFFLPGDTLLFSIGLFAHTGIISITTIIPFIIIAACVGNVLGYYLGALARDKKNTVSFLKKIPEKYIIKTELFYKKYGIGTVILSRFVPVVRTIAPFLAGVSRMNYKMYILFSLVGAVLWGTIIPLLGYFLARSFSSVHIEYVGIILMLAATIVTPIAVYLSKKYIKREKNTI